MTEVALPTAGIINADYVLDVADNSMHTFGIHENDMVFIRAQDFAESGDFVIVMKNGDAFIRRYCKCGEGLEVFMAGHSGVPSIIADGDSNVQIVGKVVGILRTFENDDQDGFREESVI